MSGAINRNQNSRTLAEKVDVTGLSHPLPIMASSYEPSSSQKTIPTTISTASSSVGNKGKIDKAVEWVYIQIFMYDGKF